MSEVLEFTLAEQSTIDVLTRGAGIDPLSLEELKNHLTQTDKTAWEIIRDSLVLVGQEKVSSILKAVISTKGIQYDTDALVKMLLSLPEGGLLGAQLASESA